MSTEEWALEYKNKQMYEWTLPSTFTREAKIAHWLAFLVLALSTLYLAVHAWNAKGPSGRDRYFYGYREEMMISIYVNLFAAVAYYGKVVADTYGHHYKNSGPVIPVMGNYAYMDYVTTCPLLVYDLLSQLRAPYKTTGSVLIFLCLLCGVVTNFYEGDRFKGPAFAWFGLGVTFFLTDYFLLYKIISVQYTKLETLSYQSHAKKALFPLRMAIGTFFVVWIAFPVIWLLSDSGLALIDESAVEILHAFCDMLAKSVYGFTLARFRTYFDKKLFTMLEELGLDGEAEMEHLDKELAHDVVVDPSHDGRKEIAENQFQAKLQSSIVRDNIDTHGDLVHAINHVPHPPTNGPPPFQVTANGNIQLTPRGERGGHDHRYDHHPNHHHPRESPTNFLQPRASPRRRSVVGMIAEGSWNAQEFQRKMSGEPEHFAMSSHAPTMKVHTVKPNYHENGNGHGNGHLDGHGGKESRLAQIQKSLEAINRELALASGGSSDGARGFKPQSQFDIPSMYNELDGDDRDKRRRRRGRKPRRYSDDEDEEEEKGVC